MKTVQGTLPALQFSAALFFAGSAAGYVTPGQVGKHGRADVVYCINTSNIISMMELCNGRSQPGAFFLVKLTHPSLQLGNVVSSADVGAKIDSTDRTAVVKAGFATGGFGRRSLEYFRPIMRAEAATPTLPPCPPGPGAEDPAALGLQPTQACATATPGNPTVPPPEPTDGAQGRRGGAAVVAIWRGGVGPGFVS